LTVARSPVRCARVAYATVQAGTYWGFTLAEMQAEQARCKAAIQATTHGAQNVIGASVNGKSFSYGPNGTWTISQWQAEIQAAMSWVDDTVPDVPSETMAVFNR